jgi:hypothetical protein
MPRKVHTLTTTEEKKPSPRRVIRLIPAPSPEDEEREKANKQHADTRKKRLSVFDEIRKTGKGKSGTCKDHNTQTKCGTVSKECFWNMELDECQPKTTSKSAMFEELTTLIQIRRLAEHKLLENIVRETSGRTEEIEQAENIENVIISNPTPEAQVNFVQVLVLKITDAGEGSIKLISDILGGAIGAGKNLIVILLHLLSEIRRCLPSSHDVNLGIRNIGNAITTLISLVIHGGNKIMGGVIEIIRQIIVFCEILIRENGPAISEGIIQGGINLVEILGEFLTALGDYVSIAVPRAATAIRVIIKNAIENTEGGFVRPNGGFLPPGRRVRPLQPGQWLESPIQDDRVRPGRVQPWEPRVQPWEPRVQPWEPRVQPWEPRVQPGRVQYYSPPRPEPEYEPQPEPRIRQRNDPQVETRREAGEWLGTHFEDPKGHRKGDVFKKGHKGGNKSYKKYSSIRKKNNKSRRN